MAAAPLDGVVALPGLRRSGAVVAAGCGALVERRLFRLRDRGGPPISPAGGGCRGGVSAGVGMRPLRGEGLSELPAGFGNLNSVQVAGGWPPTPT